MAQRRAARYLRPPAGVPVSRSPTYRSLLVLGAGVLLGAALLLWEAGGGAQEKAVERGRQNAPSSLSSSLLKQLVSRVDEKRLWSSFLTPMLIERSPGSPGNRAVRELISNHLRSLSSRWVVDLDLFDSVTPRGTLPFGNVVATLDPSASRRLVLACHLDSKWFPVDKRGRPFVGATDSAVPCALILEVVTALDTLLGEHKRKGSALTLQLLFLDGEEAFGDWSESDSLYGSRHLAQRMERETLPGGSGTQLSAIDLFVLLDLLGAPDPLIVNHYPETQDHFMRLVALEKRLTDMGLLKSHSLARAYFHPNLYFGPVEDDHVPFVRRGVPALHMIATPFPAVWHTHDDTEENLHPPTITNLCRILIGFVSETLSLTNKRKGS